MALLDYIRRMFKLILSFLMWASSLSLRVLFRAMPERFGQRARDRYDDIIRNLARRIIGGETQRTAEYNFILKNINLKSGAILDVGCSGSLLSYTLAKLGYNIYAIDVRPYFEKHPNLNFCLVDAQKTPFLNNFFDRIIAVSTIEHVGLGSYGDPLFDDGDFVVISELKSILKKGGKMLITFPFGGKFSLSPWLGSWQRIYDEKRLEQLIGNLHLEKEEYYVTDNGLKYNKVSKGEAKNMKTKKIYTPAIVCLVLRKN